MAALELAAALSKRFEIDVAIPGARADVVAPAAEQLAWCPDLVADEAGTALSDLWAASVGAAGRRERGAIYTPSDVVEWMVAEAIEARMCFALSCGRERWRSILSGDVRANPDERSALLAAMRGFTVLDPAAGAGAFLVGAARTIARTASRLAPLGFDELASLSTPARALDHCHGFEIDPESAAIASAVVALSTRESGTKGHQLGQRVVVHNPLLAGFEHPASNGGWDVIVMNPPYVGEKHIKARLGERMAETLRDARGFAGDLLIHFALGALEALPPGGAMAAIVSDTSFTMESAADLRKQLTDHHRLHSVAWCRPFAGVAVRGGILTAVKAHPDGGDGAAEWVAADDGDSIRLAPRNRVARDVLTTLPARPFFRPTTAARNFVEHWQSIEDLERLWHGMSGRQARTQMDTDAEQLGPGDWTLLGCVVRSGQGLATGDDRRFVAYVEGTDEGAAAVRRVDRALAEIGESADYRDARSELESLTGAGLDPSAALLQLVCRDDPPALPGRKPFRVVKPNEVRRSALTPNEQAHGITEGPAWVPYESSDRSGATGGVRWVRQVPTVVDWSREAVDLLHQRVESGKRRPVLRNRDLWFKGGVTHNRVTSYLRARRLAPGAIFSSESPVYVPMVEWLSENALLALLNSSLIEFGVKTFLASRNHIEVGHVRRLPIPVLTPAHRDELAEFANAACHASEHGTAAQLRSIEREVDDYVRELYGVGQTARLEVIR